jgi:hypothetical protein
MRNVIDMEQLDEMINNRQQGLFDYAKRIGFSECTEKDKSDFDSSRQKILEFMQDGRSHTKAEICAVAPELDQEGVMRRLRELRDPKHGGFDIRKVLSSGRTYLYRYMGKK